MSRLVICACCRERLGVVQVGRRRYCLACGPLVQEAANQKMRDVLAAMDAAATEREEGREAAA